MSTTPTEILETTMAAIAETVPLDPTAATEAALDIASIKDMMDAFDPASLLPDLEAIFGSLAGVCRGAVMIGPVILLVLGLAYLFFSPKEANFYFGYRCYFGMGSVQAWRFTQRFAGLVLGATGLILTLTMFTSSAGFASMDVTEMVWKAVRCLVIEAVAALLANLVVNVTAMALFNRRGEYRRAVRKEKNERQNKKKNEELP